MNETKEKVYSVRGAPTLFEQIDPFLFAMLSIEHLFDYVNMGSFGTSPFYTTRIE